MQENAQKYCAIWVNVCSLANIDYLKAAKKFGIPKRIVHCHNADNGDSFLRGQLHKINRAQIDLELRKLSDECDFIYYSRSRSVVFVQGKGF